MPVSKQSLHAGHKPRRNTPRRFPSSNRASPQLPSLARELEGLITDLINRLHTTAPSAARVIERLWQGIAQFSRDQDVRIKDYVGRVQSVLDSLAVRLRDDAVFATKARIARHSQTRSHTTTIAESLDSKLRDEIKTTR